MPGRIDFQKLMPQALFNNEVANMSQKPVHKITLFFKLALAFMVETFSLSAIKANLSFIYKKIRHQDNPEAKHVYEYSSKIFFLLKRPRITQGEEQLLSMISEIKNYDQKKGESLEVLALKLFAEPKLAPSSVFHKLPQEDISDIHSILHEDFQALCKKDRDITGAIFTFQTQMGEKANLNYETLAAFEIKTQGFPNIQKTVRILQNLLKKVEEKLIETYQRDIGRTNFQFKIDEKFKIDDTDDARSTFNKLKSYYQTQGKTLNEASKLAATCLFMTSQGGLAKAQFEITTRLFDLFPNSKCSGTKIEQVKKPIKLVEINPNGFEVTENRPYEFVVQKGEAKKIPFDLKVITACDGKTVTSSFKNEKFRPDLFRHEIEIFKLLIHGMGKKPLTAQDKAQLEKSCPALKMLWDSKLKPSLEPDYAEIAFLILDDSQIKESYGFSEEQIQALRKDPASPGKSALTYADLNQLEQNKQLQAKETFKNKALGLLKVDIQRTGLKADILGQKTEFIAGQDIKDDELEAFFKTIVALIGEEKAYNVLFSLSQNLGNYVFDTVLNSAVNGLNQDLGLEKGSPAGQYMMSDPGQQALPVELTITNTDVQVVRDMPLAAKLPQMERIIGNPLTLPIHVRASMTMSEAESDLVISNV